MNSTPDQLGPLFLCKFPSISRLPRICVEYEKTLSACKRFPITGRIKNTLLSLLLAQTTALYFSALKAAAAQSNISRLLENNCSVVRGLLDRNNIRESVATEINVDEKPACPPCGPGRRQFQPLQDRRFCTLLKAYIFWRAYLRKDWIKKWLQHLRLLLLYPCMKLKTFWRSAPNPARRASKRVKPKNSAR